MIIDLSLLQEDEDMEDVEADETEAGESSKAAVRDKVPQIQTVVQAELKSHKMHEQDVDELAEDIQSALPCSTPSLTDLLLNILRDINANIHTQRTGRDTRFLVQGLYNGPGLRDDEDGNVCVGDDVAVLFLPL